MCSLWEQSGGSALVPRWRPAPAVRYRGLLRCDALGIKSLPMADNSDSDPMPQTSSHHFDSGTWIVSNAGRHCNLITHDSIEQQRNAIVGQCHPQHPVPRERTPHQVTGERRKLKLLDATPLTPKKRRQSHTKTLFDNKIHYSEIQYITSSLLK